MPEVVSHQLASHGAKSFLHGRDLRHDVGAVTVFLDHALKPTNLSFDPPEPLQVALPGVAVDRNCLTARVSHCASSQIPPWGIRIDTPAPYVNRPGGRRRTA